MELGEIVAMPKLPDWDLGDPIVTSLGQTALYFPLVCVTCFHTRFFDLARIKLADQPE